MTAERGIHPQVKSPDYFAAEREALEELGRVLAPLTATQRRRVLLAALRAVNGI